MKHQYKRKNLEHQHGPDTEHERWATTIYHEIN